MLVTDFHIEKVTNIKKKVFNIISLPATSVTSMLETECVGDNYKILVTVLAIFITNIHYFFALQVASGTNIQRMSPTSKFCSPTLSHTHHDVTNITFTHEQNSKKVVSQYRKFFICQNIKKQKRLNNGSVYEAIRRLTNRSHHSQIAANCIFNRICNHP